MSHCCSDNSKKEVEFNVKGMSCGHCKSAIKGVLNSFDGIDKVEVDLDNGKVKVTYDENKVGMNDIEGAISEEGYVVG